MHTRTSHYRPDIDGLRAIAVLQVIFFHADIFAFNSGFIGVDVFFVISGFLITRILLEMQQNGKYELRHFYERRIRRILPVLLVITVLCTPFAFYFMLPDDLENFGQSQIATTFSVNNILLWLTENYFSVRNEFKPLVHTWSLGVEEQFYLFYPLLLFILFRMKHFKLVYSLMILWLISFLLASWCSLQISNSPSGISNIPVASFYNLPTRSFELLTGAIAVLVLPVFQKLNPGHHVQLVTKILGAFLVIISGFYLPTHVNYPNAYSLIPLLGTFLVLITEKENLAMRILSSGILVTIGLMSFSLYLIHQPLFAFYRLSSFESPSKVDFLSLIIMAFALGYLSWKYIEIPFRNREILSFKIVSVILLSLCFICVTSGTVFVAKSGYFRGAKFFPAQSKYYPGMNAEFNMHPYIFKSDKFVEPKKRHLLVIGNSQARDFINAFMTQSKSFEYEIVYRDDFDGCVSSPFYLSKMRILIENANHVVFGSAPSNYCWKNFQIAHSQIMKNVRVLGEKNFGVNLNAVMLRNTNHNFVIKIRVDVIQRNLKSLELFGKSFIDLNSVIGQDGRTMPILDLDGYLISQDGTHLTQAGAKFVGYRLIHSKYFNFLK